MSDKPSHLVERAAERLRQSGILDGSTARLLGQEAPMAAPAVGSPPVTPPMTPPITPVVAPPVADAPVAYTPPVSAPASAPVSAAAFHEIASQMAAEIGAAPDARPEPVPSSARRASSGATQPPHADFVVSEEAFTRAGMLDWSNTRDRTAEEFRVAQVQILRTAFAPENAGAGTNLVMITSARPGEGKSFSSLNLATSIARQRDREVVLVDVDAKQDSIGSLLGLSNMPGILDLAGDPGADAEQYLVKTCFPKLSILPIGPHIQRSAELFATRAMARLIRELGRRYADRVVILDAPPCLSSSDPSTMAPIVGQIVMVVEAGRTQRPEIESSLDLIQACPRITLLLNKVQVSTKHSFGSYTAKYGYGYGYGRYYSGRVGSGRVGSGRIGSGRVG